MPRRVLIVSYTFPPVGGAGVQRAAKFSKYLPKSDWSVSVLTAANPSVPVLDHSLVSDVGPDTVVVEAKTWEPSYATKLKVAGSTNRPNRQRPLRGIAKECVRRFGNFILQPDQQVLWTRNAVKAGMKLLRSSPHDAIIVTGPPFSAFAVGTALSRRAGIPLLLDYRDEWDLSNQYWENKRLGAFSLAVQRRMQNYVLRRAHAVTTTTQASARQIGALVKRVGSQASVQCIYNGYDADDFLNPLPMLRQGSSYRLAYIGTLWNLTTVKALVSAVQRLAIQEPKLAARLVLTFAGRRTPGENELLATLGRLPCQVELLDYVSHSHAVDLMRQSDGLCALLADLPGAERVVPAKVFEYMASGRTLWTIAPRGELWDIVEGYPNRALVEPHDIQGLASRLATAIVGSDEIGSTRPQSFDVSRYSRESQARQLAVLLAEICNGSKMAISP